MSNEAPPLYQPIHIEGWLQVGELSLALLLSALIGVERQIRQKSAGLRTHTLVGVGAALFVLISKYAFTDMLVPGRVVLDPSRVRRADRDGHRIYRRRTDFVRRGAVRASDDGGCYLGDSCHWRGGGRRAPPSRRWTRPYENHPRKNLPEFAWIATLR